MRLPGQVLNAALQEWEFTELRSPGLPLYCQGVFDAITLGKYCQDIQLHERDHLLMYSGSVMFVVCPDETKTVLVFRGSVFWTVSASGSVSGPLGLRQRWSDLPQAIEAAAFSPLDSKMYFFKGTASLISLIRLSLPFKDSF